MSDLQHPADPRPVAPPIAWAPPRTPWSLKAAGWIWVVSGALFALGPALATLLLQAQYQSLKRQAFRLADFADSFDTDELLQIERTLAEFERVEAAVLDASGWVWAMLLIVYLCAAAISFAAYALLGRRTALGDQWARVTATVLAALSTPLIFLVWQLFAALSWLPVTALWANHLGIVLIVLHTAGVVCSWLPASNAYVRWRSSARRAASTAATAVRP